MIYADHAATTALSKAALTAMLPYFTEYCGNPSSTHAAGTSVSRGILAAREQLALLLDCTPREIYFTSGGSEANNQALRTIAAIGKQTQRRHIVCSAFEHPSVLRTLDELQDTGFSVTRLVPNRDGLISAADVQAAMRPDTVAVSVMLANNEIGTLQPIAEIAADCRARGVLLHTDAVQAVGHIPVSVRGMQADLLSLSAHKFNGPTGTGVLIARRGIQPYSLIRGGGQERGSRAGTEHAAGIVGMAAALQEKNSDMPKHIAVVTALREQLISGLLELPQVTLTGSPDARVPGIAHFCIQGVESETVLALLDERGICASAGSACAAGALEPSHVLRSMGISGAWAQGALRLSLGADNTPEEVRQIILAVSEIVTRLRKGIV